LKGTDRRSADRGRRIAGRKPVVSDLTFIDLGSDRRRTQRRGVESRIAIVALRSSLKSVVRKSSDD
jgi:hypothetical protein